MSMRIGITGGTGFLGSRLAARLGQRGDVPVVFTRNPVKSAQSLGAESRHWEATQPLSPESVRDLDAVVHLAGESVLGVWTPKKMQRIRDVRVMGARNLAEAIGQASPRPRLLLSSSASGYYGDRKDEVLTESSARGVGLLAQLCADWEAEAMRAEDAGVRVVLLRTTLPLDPGGGLLRALLVPFRLGLGAVLGNGRQWMPWIHIEDWLALVLRALDHSEVVGPLNLASPQPVRNVELTRILAGVLGRPAFLRVPELILSRIPQAREGILVSQRVVPAKAEELKFQFAHPDLKEALQDLLSRG